MDEVTCKKCSKCQQFKPLNCFTNESRSRDGKQYYCKDCKSKYQAKYMSSYLKDKGDEVSLRHALWALTKHDVLDVDLSEYLGCCKLFYRFWINQVVGHERFNFLKAHALPYSSFHTNQPHTVLIFNKLAYRSDPSIPEMVYVINSTLTIF